MVLIPLMPAREMQEQEGQVQGLLQLQNKFGVSLNHKRACLKNLSYFLLVLFFLTFLRFRIDIFYVLILTVILK